MNSLYIFFSSTLVVDTNTRSSYTLFVHKAALGIEASTFSTLNVSSRSKCRTLILDP